MKIIISHDVDHLYSSDHYFRDFFFQKLWFRITWQLINGKIGVKQWLLNIFLPFKNCLENMEEVIVFEKKLSITSTFFFATSTKGRSMSYSFKKAIPYIYKVIKHGFEVGIHGVNYYDIDEMRSEKYVFEKEIGLSFFGIRMHYLAHDLQTINKLSQLGYCFDSTQYTITKPYKIDDMWEIPLCLMEQDVVTFDFEESKKNTLSLLSKAHEAQIPYFSILFHDHLFSNESKQYKEWYTWFLEYLSSKEYEFITFKDAVNELSSFNN